MDGEKGGCPGRDAGMGEQNKWVTGKKKEEEQKVIKKFCEMLSSRQETVQAGNNH